MFCSAGFAVMGAIILLVLSSEGALQLKGIALGAGFGLWLALGFLIGREVYGSRKNVAGLLVFMLAAIAVGLFYHLGWQLPYISTHRTPAGFVEQISGMAWSLSLAALYLAREEYRHSGQ